MSEAVMGRCLCGSVRYQCEGELGPANYCHCEDCRKCTGSAFNVGVRIELVSSELLVGSREPSQSPAKAATL